MSITLVFNILSYLPLCVFAYFIALKINNMVNRNIIEARESVTYNINKKDRRKNKLINDFTKNKSIKDILKKKEIQLKQLGNPFSLSPISYYTTKIIILIVSITLVLITHTIINMSLMYNLLFIGILVFIFFYVDIAMENRNKNTEKNIKNELPVIYNMLEVQTYGNIPIEHALCVVCDVLKDERLKKSFIELSAEIITKNNLDEALDVFNSKFKSIDIYNFVLTIKQGMITGRIRSMLESQRYVLYKGMLNNKDIQTEGNNAKVGICAILIMICTSAMVLFGFWDMISGSIALILNI